MTVGQYCDKISSDEHITIITQEQEIAAKYVGNDTDVDSVADLICTYPKNILKIEHNNNTHILTVFMTFEELWGI